MGAEHRPDDAGGKPFMEQVFEDQAGPPPSPPPVSASPDPSDVDVAAEADADGDLVPESAPEQASDDAAELAGQEPETPAGQPVTEQGHEQGQAFIDQVFEDQSRPPKQAELMALGLAVPEPGAAAEADAGDLSGDATTDVEKATASEPAPVVVAELSLAEQTLVDEAMKKSGLIWVSTPAVPAGRAFWHSWLDSTAYLLTGPGEQPDPGWTAGSQVSVLVRSKDNAHRLVTWDAIVTPVDPADDDWEAATTALAAGRLNLSESAQAPSRWASGTARVYRLQSTGTIGEGPGSYADASHRAAPVPTSATTTVGKPWVLHKRGHSGRPLS